MCLCVAKCSKAISPICRGPILKYILSTTSTSAVGYLSNWRNRIPVLNVRKATAEVFVPFDTIQSDRMLEILSVYTTAWKNVVSQEKHKIPESVNTHNALISKRFRKRFLKPGHLYFVINLSFMGFLPTGISADAISDLLSSTKFRGKKTKMTFHIVCGPSLIIQCAIPWLIRPGHTKSGPTNRAKLQSLVLFPSNFYSQQTVFKDKSTSQAHFKC